MASDPGTGSARNLPNVEGVRGRIEAQWPGRRLAPAPSANITKGAYAQKGKAADVYSRKGARVQTCTGVGVHAVRGQGERSGAASPWTPAGAGARLAFSSLPTAWG